MTEGLFTAGPVVVLTGAAAKAARDCVYIAMRTRRHNGLPNSNTYTVLAQALTDAVSAEGRSDVPKTAVVEPVLEHPISVKEAARMIQRSPRQITRLAPRLGGRLIGGRWLLDRQAVLEHMEGTK